MAVAPEFDVNGFQLVPVTPVSLNTNLVVTASTNADHAVWINFAGFADAYRDQQPGSHHAVQEAASPSSTIAADAAITATGGQRGGRDQRFAADRDRLGQRQRRSQRQPYDRHADR